MLVQGTYADFRPPVSCDRDDSVTHRELLELRFVYRRPSEPGVLSLEVRNDASTAAVIDAGVMLANGASQYVSAITMSLRDSAGVESEGSSLDPAGVAGRLDPLILCLPPGASTRLPLRLARYLFHRVGSASAVNLVGGERYTVRARLTARRPPASELNLDVKGLATLSYWTGTATSNGVTSGLSP
jgi:hypothetical protein